MFDYTVDQALSFDNAYVQLKKAKIDEDYLDRHREQILSATDDGVSDADMMHALKAAYPGILVTRHTLKKLREKWTSEHALSALATSEV